MKDKQKIIVDKLTKENSKNCIYMPVEMISSSIIELIKRDHPNWDGKGHMCIDDLNLYRTEYVKNTLETERGELTKLEDDVLESLRKHETLALNVNQEFEKELTFGERMSDKLASFGGSWKFIIIFGCILVVWIIINSIVIAFKPFDPFPFILLNLILSCVAAIQAPIIMMSQNRQEAKDRMRSEHDYRINLKSELEIRHLHEKLDHFLMREWQRLLEIQQIQTDLMQELIKNRVKENQ